MRDWWMSRAPEIRYDGVMDGTLVERAHELWEHNELGDAWKWIESLSPRHQRLFFAEALFEWGQYCATKDDKRAREFFEDWLATADADANREHSAFLLEKKSDDDYEPWNVAS